MCNKKAKLISYLKRNYLGDFDTDDFITLGYALILHILILQYLFCLLLVLANDVESNPGPNAISGVCRLCGSDAVTEQNWFKVEFFTSKYPSSVERIFHHGEDLVRDHELNPKYVCRVCADLIRNDHKAQSQHKNIKRQRKEKQFLPQFVPSEVDCKHGKCNHKASDSAVLKVDTKEPEISCVQCNIKLSLVIESHYK